jgi:hypothetical protein
MTGSMFKGVKKRGNHLKQFTFVARSCAHFRSFGVHNSMSVESASKGQSTKTTGQG